MRRQLRVSLLLGALALIVAGLIHPTPSNAGPPAPTSSGDWRSVITTPGSYVIKVGLEGEVSAERVASTPAKTAPSAVAAYPPHGPYWQFGRWANSYTYPANGFPNVCVSEHPDATDYYLGDDHPLAVTITDWNGANDFHTAYRPGGADCWAVNSTKYRVDLASGARTDTCNHTFITFDENWIVNRAIVYFDHEAFNFGCFNDAEINTWRTSTIMGIAYGLLWHRGDGAPSCMSSTAYIRPQAYDRNTLDWYN